MLKNSSFTHQDIRFLTKQIARAWSDSTPEQREEFRATIGRAFRDGLKLVDGYSGLSEPKRPAKDGTITISTEKMAIGAQVAIGITLSRDESSRAVARLLQSLISTGVELFPGQITLDRKEFLRIMVNWYALVSKLAVAARAETKKS